MSVNIIQYSFKTRSEKDYQKVSKIKKGDSGYHR